MTAAVVAPLPLSLSSIVPDVQLQDPAAAEARKRRREILALQRTMTCPEDVALLTTPAALESSTAEGPVKKRRFSTSSESTAETVLSNDSVTSQPETAAKKPQKKYDPDVPMSKDELAAWRREQRRKRNRESAAASRQRQRERINELEIELNDWKTKYEAIQEKIRALEGQTGATPATTTHEEEPRATTPEPVLQESEINKATPRASPTSAASFPAGEMIGESKIQDDKEDKELSQPIKMTSRPA
jgi:hypothetical protein